jgi:hypothetical protein
MPHRHPEDRVYTVMSGVFYIGPGSRFDDDRLQVYPPGAQQVRNPSASTTIGTMRRWMAVTEAIQVKTSSLVAGREGLDSTTHVARLKPRERW